MLLPPHDDYARLRESFAWNIPARYNIGVDVCDRWAALEPERAAIIDAGPGGPKTTTFAALRDRSNRLARSLARLGVQRGDRVAVFLPQMAEVVVSHVAIYKLGAIVLPLAAVFGADALSYRLRDAGARVVVTDAAGAAKLLSIAPGPPSLEQIISIDGRDGPVLGLPELMEREAGDFDPVFFFND